MVAAFNAPDDPADLVAAFNSQSEAQAYADAYGGTVTPVGVAFTVGRGADHAKAKADIAALRAEQDARLGVGTPPPPSGLTNAEIEAIVEKRVAAALDAAQGGDKSDKSDNNPS